MTQMNVSGNCCKASTIVLSEKGNIIFWVRAVVRGESITFASHGLMWCDFAFHASLIVTRRILVFGTKHMNMNLKKKKNIF